MRRICERRSRSRVVAVALVGVVTLAAVPFVVVVVTSRAAGALSVSDEASLRTAWADPTVGSIEFSADIHLTCSGGLLDRPNTASNPIVVTGAGHTLFQDCAGQPAFVQHGAGAASVSSLTITGAQVGVASVSGAPVSLTDATVTSGSGTRPTGVLISSSSQPIVTLTNSTVSDMIGDQPAGILAIGNGGTASVTMSGSTITNIRGIDAVGILSTGADTATTTVTSSRVSDVDGLITSNAQNPTGIATVAHATATTSVTGSTVQNVSSAGSAGPTGIFSVGDTTSSVTLRDSMLSGVVGSGTGAAHGVFANATGTSATVQLDASTVTGVAGPPGTLTAFSRGSLSLGNSTVSDNSAGIDSATTTSLVYSDVIDSGHLGAQIVAGTDLRAFGSVVAGHLGGPDCAVAGTVVSYGFNASDDLSCGFTQSTDRGNVGDPKLAALGNNGGPTPTRVPLPGSPLLDAIPTDRCQADGAAGVTTDQRGFARPSAPSDACDIGSVELPVPLRAPPRFTG